MTKQWEDHRHIIIREYKDNNKPLHEVKKFMEERYRFKASIRAYRSRFDRWRVRKYTCRKPTPTSRRRGNSLGAKSSYTYSSDSSNKSVRSESLSDDSSGSVTGSPPLSMSLQRRHIRRMSQSTSSLSPKYEQNSSIHYIGSGMYESTTTTTTTPTSISTSTEDFLTPTTSSPSSIFEQPLRQLYPRSDTDHHHHHHQHAFAVAAGLLSPASTTSAAGLLHSHLNSQGGIGEGGGSLVSNSSTTNNSFRYPLDTTSTTTQGGGGIYRLVHDPFFHHPQQQQQQSKFININKGGGCCSQPSILDHHHYCFHPDRVVVNSTSSSRFLRPIAQ